tara:strand:+ start:6070 stop:6705 length:636 start_codon:yes stop_codon:yes gene_type:complete
MIYVSRRRLFLGGTAAAALLPRSGISAAERLLTPSGTEGPFYPDRLPLHTDNDLLSVAPGDGIASGEIFHLMGRVVDPSGTARPGMKIEIWQCDANGVYLHSGDSRRGTFDRAFQGFGTTVTDRDGAYRFRTITPVSYPGRTPHIHFKVKSPQGRVFTSQLYIDGHPSNDGDFLFNRLRTDRARRAASVRQVPAPELDENAVKGTFDIVLG